MEINGFGGQLKLSLDKLGQSYRVFPKRPRVDTALLPQIAPSRPWELELCWVDSTPIRCSLYTYYSTTLHSMNKRITVPSQAPGYVQDEGKD
jgi:hypothetical protein